MLGIGFDISATLKSGHDRFEAASITQQPAPDAGGNFA
jgi:hypothetical protein